MILEKAQTIVILVSLLFLTACSEKIQIFVATDGNDQNEGSINAPFKTLERARQEVRTIDKDQEIIVYLRGGYYQMTSTFELSKEDSGTEEHPIKYTAFESETVTISGGQRISKASVEPLNPKEKELFSASLIDNIHKINLTKLKLSNFGQIKNVGFSRPYNTASMELFVNKKPFFPARYPNEGNIPMGKVLDPGSLPTQNDFSNRGGRFTYEDSHVNSWQNLEDLWISGYFNKGWAEDAVKVAEIDSANQVITTAQAHHYGYESGAPWRHWYAFNIQEEIDMDGEYYLNRKTGELYFYWENSEPINLIEVSLLEDPLIAMENASFLQFSNLNIECSRGMGIYIENGEGNKIENCVIRNLGGVGVCLGKGVVADHTMKHDISSAKITSRSLGSLPQYLYKNTTFNTEAGKNHGIINCHIYQIGAGAVVLGGGDRKTLVKGGNYVQNCEIHDFNRIEKSYRPGIWITGVGNRISNCELYNAPMMAIWMHGNDHIIEYNDFHDVVMEMHDQGAIYLGRNPTERGHIIRYNYFHDLGSERLSVGVYHDDGACGATVHGNIFYKSGSMPVLIGGGNDHVYTNNIFIDCPKGIHVDNRKQGWAKGSGDKGGRWEFESRMNAVNFSEAPYVERYPQLKTYWEEDEAKKYPKNNLVKRNIFFQIEEVLDGDKKWVIWENNRILNESPSFWDPIKKEFVLINGNIEFSEIDGFESINFNRIGMKKTK